MPEYVGRGIIGGVGREGWDEGEWGPLPTELDGVHSRSVQECPLFWKDVTVSLQFYFLVYV